MKQVKNKKEEMQKFIENKLWDNKELMNNSQNQTCKHPLQVQIEVTTLTSS